MGLVAVLDVGKTNVKLTGFGPDLSAAWRRSIPNAPLPGGPFEAIDTGAIWDFLLDGLGAMTREAPVTDVIATTHGCAFSAIDRLEPDGGDRGDGLAVPAMDYEWEGVRAHDAAYDAIRPPFAETGSPALPAGQNGGRQLHYVMREHPDAWARVRAVLPLPQWFAWRLCGVAASDVSSLGSHSDLWAPGRGAPSSLACALGLDRLLAPVRPAGAVLGPMRGDLARALGLAAPPRVRTGIHDSNASLAPFLRSGEPLCLVSSGTWAIAFAPGATPGAGFSERRDCLLNVDATGRPVPSARAMLGREFAALCDGSVPAGPEDASRVMAAGAMILPSHVPGVGPFPDRPGTLTGHAILDEPAGRRAAASLYVALILDAMLRMLDAGGRIVLDGPLGADPIVPSALAALAGRPVGIGASDASEGCARMVTGAPAPASRGVGVDPARAKEVRRYAQRWHDVIASG